MDFKSEIQAEVLLFLFIKVLFILMSRHTSVLLADTNMHHVSALCPGRPEEYTKSPETKMTDSYELLCELWEPNPL